MPFLVFSILKYFYYMLYTHVRHACMIDGIYSPLPWLQPGVKSHNSPAFGCHWLQFFRAAVAPQWRGELFR